MKTKTAAIKHARANVKLYQVGRQWQLSTWDASARAWRQGPLRDYWSARARQSQELIDQNSAIGALDGAHHADAGVFDN